ncbi:hypothetical protein Fmac_008922 [Flemingia macrophylla]|uniref:Uncharacterized protein n=1 Tax=Flemingia macrophylla TaxID=520843 RepID=A0ABD1MZM4_9FABA
MNHNPFLAFKKVVLMAEPKEMLLVSILFMFLTTIPSSGVMICFFLSANAQDSTRARPSVPSSGGS